MQKNVNKFINLKKKIHKKEGAGEVDDPLPTDREISEANEEDHGADEVAPNDDETFPTQQPIQQQKLQ